MLPYLPFLIGPLSMGVISLLIFMGSVVILTIPVFATRGSTQALWFALVGFLLTVEAAALITLTVLVSNGTIWN